MNEDCADAIDYFDPQSALAEAERITLRYRVLLANLRSRIFLALCLLLVLVFVFMGIVSFYLFPSQHTIVAGFWQFLPSLLVVLLFAIVSTARWMQTLCTAKIEARVALDCQVEAQDRFRNEREIGSV